MGVLKKVRTDLNLDVSKMLYNALVLPMFDYSDVLSSMNTLYMGRLHKLQNRGAEIILHLDRRSHVTDMLYSVKWLSVKYRCYLHTNGIITKLPESGVLCDNITEFGVAEDHLSP